MKRALSVVFVVGLGVAAGCSQSDATTDDTGNKATSGGHKGGAAGAVSAGSAGSQIAAGADQSGGSAGAVTMTNGGGAAGGAVSAGNGGSNAAGQGGATAGAGGSAGQTSAGNTSGGAEVGGAASTGGAGGSIAGGMSAMAGNGGSAGSGCIPSGPTPEVLCDGIDNDCNGQIDDVDVGDDGVCDCLRIGIVGNPGSNPSANFQAWLQGLGTTVTRVNTDAMDVFDAALLHQFDVVIFDWLPRAYTADEAQTLKTWVDAGGGFMTMSGYANNPAPDFYPNTFLAPYGLSYGGALSIAEADKFFPHPVTAGISEITFEGGYTIAEVDTAGVTNTLIAQNADGNIGYVTESGDGRGVIWGDEWIEFDSEWTKLPQIKSFWVNIMEWIGPRKTCKVIKPLEFVPYVYG